MKDSRAADVCKAVISAHAKILGVVKGEGKEEDLMIHKWGHDLALIVNFLKITH